MTFPIFIDANVPIYAGGAEHPLRMPCRDVLLLAARRQRAFSTSAEVLQELLHRYVAIRRWPRGQIVFDEFARLMQGRIAAVQADDVQHAANLAEQFPGLAARDLLHLAVMARIGSDTVVSADRDFDRVSGIERLDPAGIEGWRDLVLP